MSRQLASATAERRIRTEDVVKDSPLPEFRLDLAFIMELLRPQRKLRPRRKQVRYRGASTVQCIRTSLNLKLILQLFRPQRKLHLRDEKVGPATRM